MALEQLDLETGLNKPDFAIQFIQSWEPKEGYYLAFSGGKDSVVLYDLVVKSGVKFDAHYCVSPIDPPPLWKFIKENYPSVQWDYHARGFWKLVLKKDLPLRQQRWCCEYIKEAGGENRVVLVGNRSSESTKRSKQCFLELPDGKRKVQKTIVRPILKFTEHDVWQYIHENNLHYCELYDQGFSRLGCILCPNETNADNIALQIESFPKIINLWLLACNRIVENYKARSYISKHGKPMKFKPQTGEELFQWWIKRK